VNFVPGKIPLPGKSYRKCVYIVYQPRRWPNIVQSLVRFRRCSNEAKMRNLLKFAGVPQTNETIWGASGLKFTILWERVGKILLFNKFFSDCQYVPSLLRYSPSKLCDGARWRIFCIFLRPVFSASRMQQVWDLHSKFALRPHHVWKYGRHPICDGWDQARNKKRRTRMWANG